MGARLEGIGVLRFTTVDTQGGMRVHDPIVRGRVIGTLRSVRALLRVLLFAVGSIAVVAVASASQVSAHTDLDFTLPADGTTVGQPVEEITIGFSDAVTLIGNGFEVLDPQGTVLQPFPVTDDDKIFRLQLDPPLAGGPVGVRYTVSAADGHVIEGAFSFTAAAEPPPPTTAPPATTAPPVTTAAPITEAPTTVAPTTVVATAVTATPDTPSSTAPDAGDDSDDGDGARTALVAALVVAALAAGGFLVYRSRRAP